MAELEFFGKTKPFFKKDKYESKATLMQFLGLEERKKGQWGEETVMLVRDTTDNTQGQLSLWREHLKHFQQQWMDIPESWSGRYFFVRTTKQKNQQGKEVLAWEVCAIMLRDQELHKGK